MRIVMLTNAVAPDKLGGLERYVRELAASLVAAGEMVTVVAKLVSDAPRDEVGADGVRIIRYPVASKRSPLFALAYPALVTRGVSAALRLVGHYDVLHAHFVVPALQPLLLRRPYVYTFHAPVFRELLVERQDSFFLPRPVQQTAKRALRRVEKRVVAGAEEVLTLSDFMRSEVARLSPATAARTRVLPGGLDTSRFVTSSLPRIEDDRINIFTARRLTPRTGVSQLVDAMPAIFATHPEVRLRIAGDGRQRETIERRIRELGVGDRVQLLGRISEEELVANYQRADLAVTPTQELEGFGLSTAEAMACGTPCVVTPAGANPEVAGLLSPELVTDDITSAAIADKINTLLTNPDRLSSLASQARAVVEPALGWTHLAKAHQQIYSEVPDAK